MIIALYVLFVILGFVCFSLAVALGSLLKGEDPEDRKNVAFSVMFVLIAGLLFMTVALESTSITQDFCENQVTQSVTVNGTTTNTNQIECTTQRYSNTGLSWFFYGMVLICLVLFVIYIMRTFEE